MAEQRSENKEQKKQAVAQAIDCSPMPSFNLAVLPLRQIEQFLLTDCNIGEQKISHMKA